MLRMLISFQVREFVLYARKVSVLVSKKIDGLAELWYPYIHNILESLENGSSYIT